jgi:hypothetical protein
VDLYKTIRILHEERERLGKLIAYLEHMKSTKTGPARRQAKGRRGRKRMSAAERKAVSARMRKYWAARRAAGAGQSPQMEPSSTAASV